MNSAIFQSSQNKQNKNNDNVTISNSRTHVVTSTTPSLSFVKSTNQHQYLPQRQRVVSFSSYCNNKINTTSNSLQTNQNTHLHSNTSDNNDNNNNNNNNVTNTSNNNNNDDDNDITNVD